MNRLTNRLFSLALIALLTACGADDDGGPGNLDAGSRDRSRTFDQTSGFDVGGGQDSGAQPDLTPLPDTTPDMVVEEPVCGGFDQVCCSGVSCDPGLACLAGRCNVESTSDCPAVAACLEPAEGSPDVPINTASGNAPNLAGGTISNGWYELDRIDVYTDLTFSGLVTTVTVTSNGNSFGSLEFDGADWGFDASLDMFIDIVALGQSFAQTFAQRITAGGCYTVSGNELVGDLTDCGAEWPEGSTPPSSLDFEVTASGIRLLLILSREAILAAVPEDDRTLAGLAIEGDLPVLFTFSR